MWLEQELIRLQKAIKETSLAGKERNELRTLLQTGFEYINRKQKDFAEKQKRNYQEIKPEVTKAVSLAKSAKDTRQASQELKQVQGKLKSLNLSRQDRDELWGLLQQGFDAIKRSRDEQSAEQIRNEKWLHKQVWDCELEVKSTSDFRATKEKLKSVSQEVRQANLKREDRDKLKARLDDAFRVLKDRQDREYKQRQETHKNKLREIIARKRASRTNLEDSIRKDERYVSELYDKYRKVRSGPKELEIKRSIDSKISQVNQRISSKREKIRSIDRDIIDLEYKLRA